VDESLSDAYKILPIRNGFEQLHGTRFGYLRDLNVPTIPVISIVDDDFSVLEALADLITAMGFEAMAHQHPDEFLASDRRDVSSCLIADMQMPGMSGLELHGRLVSLGTPIPTILITAFPNDRDRERALKVGIFGYLAKPINETDLLSAIHSILKRPRAEKGQ
jgi:FixJ family two-component response regulator